MDIKEIALNETKRMQAEGWAIGDSSGVVLVERVIAEITKQNKPVAWARYPKFTGSTQRQEVVFKKPDDLHNWVWLYTITPTAEQIANETAEAIAAYITSGRYMVLNPGVLISAEQHTQYLKNHDIYQANAIRRGAWKEFKR